MVHGVEWYNNWNDDEFYAREEMTVSSVFHHSLDVTIVHRE